MNRGVSENRCGWSLDIDDFRAINDTFGSAAGDELLSVIVARLHAVASGLWLGRIEGDAFMVLIPYASMPNLSAFASDVIASCAQPTTFAGEDVYFTVSVGLARYLADATDLKGLLSSVEVALREAKNAGKNTWRCYNDDLGRRAALRARSLQNLRRIYERGDFRLHYQPKVALAAGRLTGYEALLRWHSPIGIESAGELVAIAEQCGFIGTLGEWVIRTAAEQSRLWRDIGYRVPIAVNVSGMQLHNPRVVEMLEELVRDDPRLPRYLLFELTESVLADDAQKTLDCMTRLAAMGFQFHIDDFGTGYSSLSRLSRLPVTTLKIDRSFIEGTPHKREACAVVKGIITLARALNLTVVAEGVETEEQADFLHEAGCEEAQGYHFGCPQAVSDIEAALRGCDELRVDRAEQRTIGGAERLQLAAG